MRGRSVKYQGPVITILKSHSKIQAAKPTLVINFPIFHKLRGKKFPALVLTRPTQLIKLNKRLQAIKWGLSFINTPLNKKWTQAPALMRHLWKRLSEAKDRPARGTFLAPTSKRIWHQRPVNTTMEYTQQIYPNTQRLASDLTLAVRDYEERSKIETFNKLFNSYYFTNS